MTTDAMRGHIDAETLAAWAEHSLSAEAAAAVEEHLSNCDRCQEVLAAFVRSEPAAGAVIIPFWSRRPVRWSAAGLAAAAAIIAMIYVARPPTSRTPETTMAQAPIDSLRPAATAPSAAPPTAARTLHPSPAPQSVDRQVRLEKSVAAKESRADQKTAQKAAPTPAVEVGAAGGVITAPRPPAAQPAPPPAPVMASAPPPPPPAAVPNPTPTPAVSVTPAAQSLPRTAAAPPPAASAESLVMRDASKVFEVIAPDPATALARRTNDASGVAGGRGGAGAGAGGRGAASATIAARWRVSDGTRIERSIDGGKTWVALELQPALTTRLVAGAATSQFVCWFVGADGVVLLTTDGRTVRRVSIPETVGLVSVTAEDGLRAVVIAVDGRKFTTVDGGLTWK